ncbi:AAA family ATPase [Paraburkholderia sp. BR10937]|uniref:trifunctional serine/threonine-protein kinase/ATP-binding protein/sensor histidine kinase n=1 Tax=Paraburkholderia sp. BR10937 TaxID=3236994 RepID=UPI0034D1FACB
MVADWNKADSADLATRLIDAKLTLLRDGAVQLYRVEKPGSSVLAAIPLSPAPAAGLAQLRHEYGIRARLEHGFALRPIQFVIHNQNPAMLLHDPRGQMLNGLVGAAMPLEAFMRHAARMALALASAHAAGLVHGALTPANFMVHSEGRRAWLTGFRALRAVPDAEAFDSDMLANVDPERVHYVAPEATGRLRRPVDARSDLYSLGCIFYQMLTGSVLFPDLAPSEEIHAHIARRPLDGSAASAIAPQLLPILLRLLAKEPQERYQAATEVVKDLFALHAPGSGDDAPAPAVALAAVHGVDGGPRRSDLLFGREREMNRLLQAVLDASVGEPTPLVLVEGPAGIGKTALVQHLRQRLADTPHEFAQGKCEQADGAKPYASLARALHSLLRSALGYLPADFEQLQRRIADTLADEVSIVTTIFPELARIVGERAYRPAVSAHAERPRFLDAMTRLLGTFAVRGRPLIFFLDDLQWADEGTLEVLTHAARSLAGRHVLFVGAMRENEGNGIGPRGGALRAEGLWQKLPLGPLSHDDVGALLTALLPGAVDQFDMLSNAIWRCTGGNALFTIEFVRALIDDGVLACSESTRAWQASVPAIEGRMRTPNLIELISGKIGTLSANARAVLRCLALLAEPAVLNTIVAAMRLTRAEVEAGLSEAVDAQLLNLNDELYAFAHDRVRDAVYNGLRFDERETGHLEIGRELLASREYQAQSISVFVVANQLNEAVSIVTAPEQRHQFAMINLEAARSAKEATAYASAISYLLHARTFLQGSSAPEAVGALIDLRWGECEFLCMEINPALRRLNSVRAGLLDFKDRAALARLRAALYVTNDQPDIAVAVGLRYLAEEAEVVLPLMPTAEDVDREYARFRQLFAGRSIDALVGLPMLQDEGMRNAMDVLADLIPAALFTSQRLVELLILRMTNMGLQHGHSDASCYAYVCLSCVVGARYSDYATVARFGELAMRLPAERGIAQYQGRVQMCYGTVNLPWTGVASSARRHIEESIRRTAEEGDITFSVYARRNLAANLIFAGVALSDVQQCVEDAIKVARQAGFSLIIDAVLAQAWLIRAMRGVPVDVGVEDPNADYMALLKECLSRASNRDLAAFSFWTYQLQTAYLFGHYSTALRAEDEASRTAWSSPAFIEMVDFIFYRALLRLALSRQSTGQARDAHLQVVHEQLVVLDVWADASPDNFRSRERLVRAELAFTLADAARAQGLYEEAIALAEETRAFHLQGLARELAARFCAHQGWHAAEQGYLVQARSAYACWGADAKVRQLEDEFPSLGVARAALPRAAGLMLGGTEHQFDVDAVIRAAQALSGEIALPQLIQVLLDIALQYAGADRVVLCLLDQGMLNVVAQATFGNGAVEVDFERTTALSDILPASIAYTTLRTKESVLLDDALADSHYGTDAYVRSHRSRSIMCVPLIKQGELTGLLYLENGQISGTFTLARLRILEVLASQAAISLENAKLYQNIESEHERRAAAERHLRDTQGKLDRAANLMALGELVAFIVHEVSQPVSAIGMSSIAAMQWLRRDVPNLGEAIEMLEQISTSSQRAANIVESIRAMVRKSPPKIGPMDIHEAIREVVGLLREQIHSGGVRVTGNFAAQPLRIEGDRILLQQVIMNLILNALEAMSKTSGRERQIEIQTSGDAHAALWVSVTDTGPGIAAKVVRHLFDSLATTKDAGMGMGLSICKSIVEAHGGQIEAASLEGKGACFRFSLPQGRGRGRHD